MAPCSSSQQQQTVIAFAFLLLSTLCSALVPSPCRMQRMILRTARKTVSLVAQPRTFWAATSALAMSSSTGVADYLAVHVRGQLTPSTDAPFYAASLHNARNSVQEPGVSRFDVLRGVADDSKFLLIEVYKNSGAPAAHKETAHYHRWRETVEPFMAVGRAASKYSVLYPPTSGGWDTIETASREVPEDNPAAYAKQRPWALPPHGAGASGETGGLLAVVVDVQVAAGAEEAFIQHTIENCRCSTLEPGVHRFDLLRNSEDPQNFVLVEIYGTSEAPARHKQTAHYLKWREAVQDMMARPRSAEQFMTLFPSPLFYHKPASLVYKGDGSEFAGSDSWSGKRGLSTAGSPASFGFQGPKVLMGRGVAAKAIESTMKSMRLQKPLLVTGSSGLQRHADIFKKVFGEKWDPTTAVAVQIGGEPTVEDANAFTRVAVENNCDSVLAIGGGSAIDIGKAVAALIPNQHRDLFDYLEVIGKGMPLENDPLPFIAVPTTSGTGSEATKNAVLKSNEHGRKVSIRHGKMYPDAAVLDPELTISCPPGITANVGMDTLCQVMEPYLSCLPNPFTDALAKEGIVRAARSLRSAVANGEYDIEAREDMAVASVMGGMCLANSKLGAVHGFAAVLGGQYENAPHGAICACLLPYVFEKNAEALQAMLSDGGSGGGDLLGDAKKMDAVVKLGRFQEVSRMITGNPSASIADGIEWLHVLLRDINIPRMSTLCPAMRSEDWEGIVEATMGSSSTAGNPVVLSKEDLLQVLKKSM